jgi:hypothetical protein
MSDKVAQVFERWTEEDRPMSDPLQATPPPIASEPAVGRTMLDRTSLPRLARLVHPLHRTMRSLFPSTIRGAINHWIEHGG